MKLLLRRIAIGFADITITSALRNLRGTHEQLLTVLGPVGSLLPQLEQSGLDVSPPLLFSSQSRFLLALSPLGDLLVAGQIYVEIGQLASRNRYLFVDAHGLGYEVSHSKRIELSLRI